MTPLIPVSDVDQTQTQLKIANVSDQTHIRHINQGILPVRYDKATAGYENIKQCQIRHINQGILPVQYDKATAGF